MTTTDIEAEEVPIRIKITQQAKKDVCEFSVKPGDRTDHQMREHEDIAWASVDRMIQERNKRGFVTTDG